MKKVIFTAIFLFLSSYTFSQKNTQNLQKKLTKNFISFYPSNVKKANGLMIKYWIEEEENKELQINGIELGLNPITIFFPFLTIFHSIPPTHHEPPIFNDKNTLKTVNGIQLGIGNFGEATINGIEMNLSGNFNSFINGISISPSINKHYEVFGLGIAPLGNFDNKITGIQIGLFNKVNILKGIQIGLWNKNEKRSLPIIN